MIANSPLVRFVVGVTLAASLTACVAPTPYQAASPRGYGYSEDRLDRNRFRITFRGNSLTTRETVEDYMLYRAAEISLHFGFDHFLMVGRDTESRTAYRSWVDTYGGRGYFYHHFPRWAYPRWYHDPWGWPTYDVEPVTNYAATTEIVMINGPRRDGEIAAFDAREVLAQVGPRVVRPVDLDWQLPDPD